MVGKVIKKANKTMISIPNSIVKHMGLESGSHVKVTDDGYRIIITPKSVNKEEKYTEEEWRKIISLKKEKGKVFKNGKAFMKNLRSLMKK